MSNVNAPETATTKELIYVDETKIGHTKREMAKAEALLNDFYRQTTETLGELSLEDIQKLPTEGKKVIEDELKSRYQFPKASRDFNLDALGLDASAAYAAYKNKSKWKPYKFNFKGGKFVLLPADQQPEITKNYHYSDTPEKRHAVKLIRDLLKIKDEMMEAGLVGNGSDAYLFEFLNYNVLTREKGIGRTRIILNPSGCIQMLNAMDKKK